MKARILSPAFKNAFPESIVIQLIIIVLASMMLDGGATAQICLFALAAYWAGASLIVFRRRHCPTVADIQLIRFGYLPLVGIAFLLSTLIWMFSGIL